MYKMRLGRTNLIVSRSGFGGLPIQRISFKEAKNLIRVAYDSGMDFFDTARGYSDSEEKIGSALADVRKNVIIATKSRACDRENLLKDIKFSLKILKTDYIDIMQLHNCKILPDPNGSDELYSTLIEAKKEGLVRFIGITTHRRSIAVEAVSSGLFDTVQFPLSHISSSEDLEVIELCKKNDVGLIAMKALSGGLITKADAAFAYFRQYENVLPIWGIQKLDELQEFVTMEKNPPILDECLWKVIERDRKELSGDFCRACGYCLPCPIGINIPKAARISLLLKRLPVEPFLSDTWKESMDLVDKCKVCGNCKKQCPYELDIPNLLKRNLDSYRQFYKKSKSE